jgi:predicted acetyltransferase
MNDGTVGPAPQLEVRQAPLIDQLPIRRMLELYQYELTDLWAQDLDAHGEYGYALDRYWERPHHQAFVFRCDGKLAGFCLVDDDVRLPGSTLWMAQFFVLKKYRRQRVGERAAHHVFDALPGVWEVGQMRGNTRATLFWRGVIGRYRQGRYTEQDLRGLRWNGWLQCFDNRSTS